MNWTDERVELLKKLWSEGFSASQIATQLGSVSRNAVIGKVHRLKLTGRAKTTAQAAKPKRKTVATENETVKMSTRTVTRTVGATALKAEYLAEAVADTRPIEEVVVPISRRLKLVQLTERTCKWPIGDPLHEDFHFCGHNSEESTPYCTYHARIAFQPSAEKRRFR